MDEITYCPVCAIRKSATRPMCKSCLDIIESRMAAGMSEKDATAVAREHGRDIRRATRPKPGQYDPNRKR